MRRFFITGIFMLGFINYALADNWQLINSSCAYNQLGTSATNPCAYCLGYGASAPSTCRPGYASCPSGKTILQISEDSYLGNVKCTSSGWCYASCSSSANPEWARSGWINYAGHPNMEIWQERSGCVCSTAQLDTTRTRCKSGYEMVGDECLLCYASCDSADNPDDARSGWVDYPDHPNMEIWRDLSGCRCSVAQLDPTRTRCKAGAEMIDGECVMCYASCDSADNPDDARSAWIDYPGHPNMEIWQERSGCTCSTAQLETSRVRCKLGYEMVGNECLEECPSGWERYGKKCLETCPMGYYNSDEDGTCKMCPQLMSVKQDENGQWQDAGWKYATGAGTGNTIAQCYMMGNSADLYFKDDSGVWQISLGKRCYHD